ncbi:mitochondrial distribution and morphology proteins-domain-containing protein [Mycena latifolia]|nr:mitochondrial distribution and morphology proteins-domain-containing protein [Mycena latifolia]
MALSQILKKTTRQTPLLLVARGSILRPSAAKLDRYDIIRTFFSAQAAFAVKQRQPCLHEDARSALTRHFHASRTRKADLKSQEPHKPPSNDNDSPTTHGVKNDTPAPQNYDNYPPFFRRLAMSLPHLPRPSRDDFLKIATGFWARARIRFKWFTIKSFRRFNADDMSAFITWFVMSQTLWIFIGTTTFFSVIFATANSLRLQHYMARAISDYLTAETGVTVIFESAIVPKWKDSRISFKNVFISRRPQTAPPPPRLIDTERFAASGYDISGHPGYHRVGDEDEVLTVGEEIDEDLNYSMFDLNIDSIDVTLSLWRWLDGKGLIEDAVIKGVRGTLDRRSVYWDPDNPLDPASFRHISRTGDFELESLQLEDVLITVYQPGGFRPYTASIFQADIRTFRKQWIFYDFLCAENIVGQFDNCLFSLHKPQSIGRTTEKDLKDGDWGRMSRIRIDGVNIDHVQRATTTEGPISWITSGKVDAVLDIKFPRDPEDASQLNAILGEIADAISTSLSSNPVLERIPAQRGLAKPPLQAPEGEKVVGEGDNKPRVIIDIDLRFRDLKAGVPLFTNDLSYVNYALIRPIVGFMNANRTLVPIRCRVVKDLADFDGSWTMWECDDAFFLSIYLCGSSSSLPAGLMDEISLQVYDAMAYHVTQANMNRRLKTVSLWSLQMTAGAMLSTLRTLVDPMSARVREAYENGRGLEGLFR